MKTLNQKIETCLIDLFEEKKVFALAVSGGPDSQCLLKAFPHVANRLGHKVPLAIGCDHGFRSETSKELDLAEALATKLGIKFIRIFLNLDKNAGNIHAMARDARYTAMRKVMKANGIDYLVTGHHYDDRAETVLIRLIRGKSIGSLGVLQALRSDLLRPMLNVSREEIMKYLSYWKVPYATDPSNDNPKYMRARVRNEIMPLLKEMNPSIVDRLNEISDEVLGNKA